ncbi:hypothetical protein [uncultured Kordia sp.]|uniref:hypothetical protein n=1 Tax=uncultured Kordia sp. TaxID=507699 RepID=UPI0026028A69|nr:hypothetical protein [uncultured Kordia sp.]
MKRFLAIFFCITFLGISFGQTYNPRKRDSILKATKQQLLAEAKTIDYTSLPKQIVKDLPLKKLSDKPTFIKTHHLETVCSVGAQETLKNMQMLEENFTSQKFFSQDIFLAIQKEIKTAIIPYVETTGFSSGILFSTHPVMKKYPKLMLNLTNTIPNTFKRTSRKNMFGYLPYKTERLESPLVIPNISFTSYIQQTNHINLEFLNHVGQKVSVSGEINDTKIFLSYQYKKGKWKLMNSKITYFDPEHATQFDIEYGFIKKHQNKTYTIQQNLEIDEGVLVSDIEVNSINKKYFTPKHLINIDSITHYDFSTLKNKKFVAYDEYFKYELLQFNGELFILKIFDKDYDDNNQKIWREYLNPKLIPFAFTQVKDKKKIIQFFDECTGYIIPKKEGLEIKIDKPFSVSRDTILEFSEVSGASQEYSSKELFDISMSYNRNFKQYYTVTEKKGKKRLYNYRNEDVLQKRYDSIIIDNFIIGIKNGKYDIYNQTFKKLKLDKVQAVFLDLPYLIELQVIQNNEMKYISLSNNPQETYRVMKPTPPYMPIMKSDISYEIKEDKKGVSIIREFAFDTLKITKEKVKNVFFLRNKKQKIITDQAPFIVLKHTDNRYSMVDIYHPNKTLLETVDRIEFIENTIRFKENNLFGYYGIHSKGRFKKLEAFQGFFAKFELPNGRKGWLDRNGKEYIDL